MYVYMKNDVKEPYEETITKKGRKKGKEEKRRPFSKGKNK